MGLQFGFSIGRISALLAVCFLWLSHESQAQSLRIILRDSLTQSPVIGGSVSVPGTGVGAATDVKGEALLTPAPAPGTRLRVEALGYRPQLVAAPAAGALLTLQLAAAAQAIEEEVLVTATRTNSRLEDLPTRVEVLGEEELTEENGIKPGNIASLLGDIAGTQIQPTSPTTGNADLRIQGLPGRYSQILRDGLPLLGGYSGSFGILQIPPLDLRQIELIKGSSSTLYGGGAIAGLVNLVSKTPVLGTPQLTFTANQSTLKESNLNGTALPVGATSAWATHCLRAAPGSRALMWTAMVSWTCPSCATSRCTRACFTTPKTANSPSATPARWKTGRAATWP